VLSVHQFQKNDDQNQGCFRHLLHRLPRRHRLPHHRPLHHRHHHHLLRHHHPLIPVQTPVHQAPVVVIQVIAQAAAAQAHLDLVHQVQRQAQAHLVQVHQAHHQAQAHLLDLAQSIAIHQKLQNLPRDQSRQRDQNHQRDRNHQKDRNLQRDRKRQNRERNHQRSQNLQKLLNHHTHHIHQITTILQRNIDHVTTVIPAMIVMEKPIMLQISILLQSILISKIG